MESELDISTEIKSEPIESDLIEGTSINVLGFNIKILDDYKDENQDNQDEKITNAEVNEQYSPVIISKIQENLSSSSEITKIADTESVCKNITSEETNTKQLSLTTNNGMENEKEKVCMCTRCMTVFKDKTSLDAHLTNSACSYQCSECYKKFPYRSYCLAHTRRHGKKLSEGKIIWRAFVIENNNTENKEKPITCKRCRTEFEDKRSLDSHVCQNPFKCYACPETFAYLYNWLKHVETHKQELSKDSSSTSSEKNTKITNDEVTTSNDLEMECNIQNTKYIDIVQTSLTKNNETQNKKGFKTPYECIVCEKTFNSSHDLKEHLSIHTGEPLYECNKCNKKFKFKSSWNTHLQSHELVRIGDRQYRYEEGRAVPHPSIEQQQQCHKTDKVKQGNIKCKRCNTSFEDEQSKILHISKRSCKPPFECVECHRIFVYRVSWIRHMHAHEDKRIMEKSSSSTEIRNIADTESVEKTENSKEFNINHISLTKNNGVQNNEDRESHECKTCNEHISHNPGIEHICMNDSSKLKETAIMLETTLNDLNDGNTHEHSGSKIMSAPNTEKKDQNNLIENLNFMHNNTKIEAIDQTETLTNILVTSTASTIKEEQNIATDNKQFMDENIKIKESDINDVHPAENISTDKSMATETISKPTLDHLNGINSSKSCGCLIRYLYKGALVLHNCIHYKSGPKKTNIPQPPFIRNDADSSKPSALPDPKHVIYHTEEKPNQCLKCNRWFRFSTSLKKHDLQIHQQYGAQLVKKPVIKWEKYYKCKFCNKMFKAKASLIKHMRLHTGGKPYECSECQERFTHKNMLLVHMKTTHPRDSNHYSDQRKKFKCSYCEKEFKRRSNFDHHIMCHTGEKPYQCLKCLKRFRRLENLKSHDFVIHQRKTQEHKLVKKPVKKRKRVTKRKTVTKKIHKSKQLEKYKCKFCDKMFTLKTMEIHMRGHEREQRRYIKRIKHKCSECEEKFTRKGMLRHMKIHPQKRYFCTWENCNKSFRNKYGPDRHMASHSNEWNHKCPSCARSFPTKKGLRQHILQRHDPLKETFECHHCGITFNTREAIIYHFEWLKRKTTTYNCPHCEIICKTRKSLNLHLKYHPKTSSKPNNSSSEGIFECENCNRTFASIVSLATHSAYHKNKSYECSHCNKRFSAKIVLDSHLKSHEKKYIPKTIIKTFWNPEKTRTQPKRQCRDPHEEKIAVEEVTSPVLNDFLEPTICKEELILPDESI